MFLQTGDLGTRHFSSVDGGGSLRLRQDSDGVSLQILGRVLAAEAKKVVVCPPLVDG